MAGNSERSISFYLKYAEAMSGQDLFRLYYEVAHLYELTFRYSFAVDYYSMALNVSSETHPELQLHILQLLYQSGTIPEMSQIDALLMTEKTQDFYVDALIFKAEILQYEEKFEEAEEILLQSRFSNLYPEIQFSLWEMYNRIGNNIESDRVLSFMKENYPDSIELSVMEHRAEKMTRLSDFFLAKSVSDEKSEKDVFIQTGVFSSRENALILKDTLTSLGFHPTMVESDSLFKILVSGQDKQFLLESLKNHGINGFTVDYP